MSRVPWAAETLTKQIQQARPSAEFTFEPEVDGFGVQRTITYDEATSKWLAANLHPDPRIEGTHKSKDGALSLTFTSSVDADDRAEFTFGTHDKLQPGDTVQAENVNLDHLAEQDTEVEPVAEQDTEVAAPKKAAPRKP